MIYLKSSTRPRLHEDFDKPKLAMAIYVIATARLIHPNAFGDSVAWIVDNLLARVEFGITGYDAIPRIWKMVTIAMLAGMRYRSRNRRIITE